MLRTNFASCRTSRHGEPFSRARFLIANHALTSGKPTWGEVHPTAPLLACPAGADDLKLTPPPANNASPVGLSNRNGKFVNIIARRFRVRRSGHCEYDEWQNQRLMPPTVRSPIDVQCSWSCVFPRKNAANRYGFGCWLGLMPTVRLAGL